jgi:S1-C subfamily serine protease
MTIFGRRSSNSRLTEEERNSYDLSSIATTNTPAATTADEGRRRFLLSTSSASLLLLSNIDYATAAISAPAADIINPTDTAGIIPAAATTSSSIRPTANNDIMACSADSTEIARINIFERVAPSVVYIDTFSEKRDVFSTNVMEVPIGSGSGFVWDNYGHIVTNFHVVQQAKSAQVAILTPGNNKQPLSDYKSMPMTPVLKKQSSPLTSSSRGGRMDSSVRPGALGIEGSTVLPNYIRTVYKARVIGVDPTKDIAVLKVDDIVGTIRPIDVGTSTGLRVGQGSLAIGNPFGLDHTLTTGVISGIGREVTSPAGRPISNVIQTDAAINPGNSGGPLLDSSGKLIGMATAIYSPSGASAGVGFAIPVDTVQYVVEMLIKNGQIIRPLLGVSILDSRQARQALGIARGILILEVKPNTPAAQVGLRGLRRSESGIVEIGDIIIAIENMSIENEGDLFRSIESYEPGDVVRVTINRPEVQAGDDGSPKIKLREMTFMVKLIPSDDSTFLNK